ncbi:MAG: hypothetical protein FJ303_19335 [Planctomycetes bacterium]|nr:hypothetical protein [Planctomycetota bacterium]
MHVENTSPCGDDRATLVCSMAPILLACVLLSFLAWSYLFLVQDFPYPHGDEIGLLNLPYRYAEFGDTRYPNHWSETFGSDTVRRYPPIAAFTLRNAYHALVGFSPVSSRVLSALMMLAVVAGGIVFLSRLPELGCWQRLLVLCQLGLTPVMIYTARSVRFEQEILFAGWMGAVVLPALVPAVGSAWLRALLWSAAGASLGLAGSSHPFGLVFGVVGLWLIVFANYWHEQDGFSLWHRLGLVGLGLILAGIPTFHWIFSDWETFRAFSQAHAKLYAGRTGELIDWYASVPPWNGLRGILPDSMVAHLTVLHQTAYEDFYNYPVPDYRFRVVLEAIFYVQLGLLGAYLVYSAWRRFQNANPWVHLAVWLAAAFLAFGLWYTPIHTYKIYTSFFVNFSSALIAWRLADYARDSSWPRAVVVALIVLASVPALGLLHYAGCHARHLVKCYRHNTHTHIALDVEFAALAQMADRLDLRRDDRKVYAHVESWIATGKHTLSLWESAREEFVRVANDSDGVVFKNINVGLYMRHQSRDSSERTAKRHRQLEQMRTLLAPMRLAGIVLNDFDASASYSFYVRSSGAGPRPAPLVACMTRDQRVEFHEATLEQDSVDLNKTITFAPGRYLLLVRVSGLAEDDLLEVTQSPKGQSATMTSVFLTPIHTISPAPLVLEIDGAPTPVSFAVRQKKCSLSAGQLYRITP